MHLCMFLSVFMCESDCVVCLCNCVCVCVCVCERERLCCVFM